MSWKWKDGSALLLPPSLHNYHLSLTAGYDTQLTVQVPQLSPYASYRTLGAYLSPSGGMEKSLEVLRNHAKDYATRIQGSMITREAALWSFLLYLLPKLTFPMVALTLTETQCSHIQSPALLALLPKLHLNRNTARSIIHGPRIYGGMDLPHIYTSQGLGQLKFLLGHLRAQDKTCKLILISHGYLQLIVGVSENFLNVSYELHHHWACSSWLTSIWLFLSTLKITIIMKQVWLPSKPTGHDINLMEYFISRQFSPRQLSRLNLCRLYLQVISLSDMVSADGKCIIGPVLEGKKLMDRRSNLNWPEQGCPSKSDWRLWASALQPLHSNTKLIKPINMGSRSDHQSWFWYLDTGNRLLQKIDDSWVSFDSLPRQRRSTRINRYNYYYNRPQPCPSPPVPLHAASVQEHSGGVLKVTPHRSLSMGTNTTHHNNTQQLTQSSPSLTSPHPFYSYLLQDLAVEDSQKEMIADSIQRDNLMVCSDGSFDPVTRKTAYGVVLANKITKLYLLTLHGPCIGHTNTRSAIRSELCSLTAITHLLLAIIKEFRVMTGSIILYNNDCSKAIKYINHPGQKFKRFLTDDYDLLCEIRTTVQQIQQLVSFKLLWVKGHFTGKQREFQHDLNAEAHTLAKTALSIVNQSSVDISPPPHLLPISR
jgi:hypothetical protein